MNRRSFLIGASTLALGQLMSGCNRQQQASLNVRLLKDSIPPQLLSEFRKVLKQPTKLNFDPDAQLIAILAHLQAWKQKAENKDKQQRWPIPFISGRRTPAIANLVTLGDYWLESAIEQELISPLQVQELAGWQQLPPRWQAIVQRDRKGQVAKDGQVWGAPYRWGTAVLAYRKDKFEELGWMPTDWSDLWRPELRDRISLLAQPREVIGLTLKKLGFSYNTQNLSQVPNLKQELLALHQQVKYYSSNKYIEPLLVGDTWLALGWSTDILSVRSTYNQIDAVVPQSGTSLWADVWVQPAPLATGSQTSDRTSSDLGITIASSHGTLTSATSTLAANASTNPSLTQQWIEFCWQPQPAQEISMLTNAASPIIVSLAPGNLPKNLQDNNVLLPASSVLDNSEFIEPLPKPVLEEYMALWKEIRTAPKVLS
ncbi:MAG: extracellular solute-binding protein [Cyanobacteriota bacterium]